MSEHETKRRPIPMAKVLDLSERLDLRIAPTSNLWRMIATEAIDAKGEQVCSIVTVDGGPCLYAWMHELQEFLDEIEELLRAVPVVAHGKVYGLPRPVDEGGSEMLSIRVTAAEKQNLQAQAAAEGISVSDLLRKAVEGARGAAGGQS